MEQTLAGLLGVAGTVIVALIGLCGILMRRERRNGQRRNGNPGNQQRVMDKLDGLQEHMTRMETKMDDAVHVLIELRTILVRRET